MPSSGTDKAIFFFFSRRANSQTARECRIFAFTAQIIDIAVVNNGECPAIDPADLAAPPWYSGPLLLTGDGLGGKGAKIHLKSRVLKTARHTG